MPIESVVARKASAIQLQHNVLGLAHSVADHEYLNAIIPTVDLTRHGVVESREQRAIFRTAFVSAAGGVGQGMMVMQLPRGRSVRIKRVQAFVVDPTTPPTWYSGIVTVDRLAIWLGNQAPPILTDVTLSTDVGGAVPPTPGTPEQLPGDPTRADEIKDELASGTDRVTYENAYGGLLVTRPQDAAIVYPDDYSLVAAFQDTFGVGQTLELVVHVVYSLAAAGAWAER